LSKVLRIYERLKVLEEACVPGWLRPFADPQHIITMKVNNFIIRSSVVSAHILGEIETLLEYAQCRWYDEMFSREYKDINKKEYSLSFRDKLRDSVSLFLKKFLERLTTSIENILKQYAKLLA
jgi:hypothetical protein